MIVNFWIRLQKLKRSTYYTLSSCRHLTGKYATASTTHRLCKVASLKNENYCKRLIYCNNINRVESKSESQRECWHCHKLIGLAGFSCPFCSVMQHPSPNVTYFQVFEIDQKFDVDTEYISKKFKDLQKIFHPDKTANKLKVGSGKFI